MHGRWYALLVIILFAALMAVIPVGVVGSRPGKENSPKHDDQRRLIVDTDMGLDDVRAIFALLAADEIEIEAIVTVEGSASIGKGMDNLIGLLELSRHDEIPVCRGYAREGLPAPPWRKTANSLCGVTFPPPQSISFHADAQAWLKVFLEQRLGDITYLSLGPLGNLSLLADRLPGGIEMIGRIWIPAELSPGGTIEAWNISYDSTAARAVFDAASEIVILDMTPARSVNAEEFLSSVKGTTHAVGWIQRFIDKRSACGAHLFIYDELLAAAAIDEDLITLRSERYRIESNNGGKLKLMSDYRGNIRIAEITEVGAAMERIRMLWEAADKHEQEHAAHDRLPAEELLKSFHGHLGPYVVLGYRMGMLALESLDSKGHFGLSAEVHSILQPPQSCLIDGVQLGSGCTLGKRNIDVYEHDGPAYVVFEMENGARIRIALRPAVPGRIRSMIEKRGVEAVGEYFLTAPLDSLFEIGGTHRN